MEARWCDILLLPIQNDVESIHHAVNQLVGIALCDIGKLSVTRSSFWAFMPHLMLDGAQV